MNNPKSYKMQTTHSSVMAPLRFLSPIHKATRQLSVHLEKIHAESGITNPEAHLVAYLLSYGPCSIGELLAVFGHKKSTLTSILDRLADRGLVLRSIHPDDRRSFLIALTDEGCATAQRIRSILETLETKIANHVSERSLAGFYRVMTAIAEVTAIELRSTLDPQEEQNRKGTVQGRRSSPKRKEKP